MLRFTKLLTPVWVALGMVTAGGCRHQITFEPQQDHNQLDSLEFVHLLAQQPVVTYDQGCRAVLLVADGEESPHTFGERKAELESRGVVSAAWGLQENDPLDRGTLGHMIFKTCRMRHGFNTWMASFTGLGDRRYALKSVIREEIISYGLSYQVPTGGEVVAALARADDYMAKKGMYEMPVGEISSPGDVSGGSGVGGQ